MTKLLFICSRNQWRSPTAVRLFEGRPGFQARSAGTEPSARVRVTAGLLGWADIVFAMERRHVERVRARFPDALTAKRVVVLDIPDDFPFMDPELVSLLHTALSEYLGEPPDSPHAPEVDGSPADASR